MVNNPLASIRDLGSIPGLGRYPGGGNGNHSSILTERPCGLQSMGSQKSRTHLSD